jgi:hypothetical protein
VHLLHAVNSSYIFRAAWPDGFPDSIVRCQVRWSTPGPAMPAAG